MRIEAMRNFLSYLPFETRLIAIAPNISVLKMIVQTKTTTFSDKFYNADLKCI